MASRILSFEASINCLWLVGVTLVFDGNPQIIVQRCQITDPRWSNHICSAADNAIIKNRAQNIKCSFGCVARSAVLLKPNVANILLFIFCPQKAYPVLLIVDGELYKSSLFCTFCTNCHLESNDRKFIAFSLNVYD